MSTSLILSSGIVGACKASGGAVLSFRGADPSWGFEDEGALGWSGLIDS